MQFQALLEAFFLVNGSVGDNLIAENWLDLGQSTTLFFVAVVASSVMWCFLIDADILEALVTDRVRI